uniref:Uncharacterized protein n=1 Tax=Sphaerodactylus townsendi TaxID=933632 RepID=A0ACB8G726_9SAUR
MIELQNIHNSDFYEPYYCRYIIGYNPHYRIRRYGSPGYGTENYNPYEPYTYLFRFRSIVYKPHDRSSPSRSWDTAYYPPSCSLLSNYGTSCHSPQDYCYDSRRYIPQDHSYHSGTSCYKPRGYSYLSGPGTGYEPPCSYGYCSSYGSANEPCGFDPIPVGRSGYAYRRRYSCRPICGEPSQYGSRIYYPPSYWMLQNRELFDPPEFQEVQM